MFWVILKMVFKFKMIPQLKSIFNIGWDFTDIDVFVFHG